MGSGVSELKGGDKGGTRLMSYKATVDLSALPTPPPPAPDTKPLIELVEYYPNTRGEDIKHKANARYLGVIERASDGFTTLSIKADSATRAHNIEVGSVYAITYQGKRTVLRTPWGRWKIRAAEIRSLLEGELEDWAKPYFDPASPKFFKREEGYVDQTDPDAERKYRRVVLGEQPVNRARREATELAQQGGCAVFLGVGLVSAIILGGYRLLA